MSKYREEDLSRIRPFPIDERESKVRIEDFVDPETLDRGRIDPGAFPAILKGNELFALTDAMCKARDAGRPIMWMIGAHVIKCGLSLYLRDLMKERFITSIATSGSATVHDTELAFFGATSEDVAEELPRGRFGMVSETAAHFEAACLHASDGDMGLGEGIGSYVVSENAPHGRYSVFGSAYEMDVPATVHVALGTDITHQHPYFPGGPVGELSMRDFRILTAVVGDAFDGGVIILFGSAVVLPEVFLKAVSINYNLGRKPRAVTTAGFDMLPQYRVRENVLSRPFRGSGVSYQFTGHHELMLPLVYNLLCG